VAVALTLPSPSPGDVLAIVNRLLRSETDQLVTTFIALLDVTTGDARLASAGHPPPVHLAAGGETALVTMRFGPPLGAADRDYPEGRLHLAPGDALVLYTDGVTEARRRGELFGEVRLVRALVDAADRRPQALVDAVRDAVASFADRLTDDLDVLALRRLA
jgi:serine phosphatase RsbU (regulator of sigma subunit)